MAADRDLLFGLLALQNGLIDQGQLVAAFQAWIRDKSRPLADHLIDRGDLDADARSGVEAMVALHLKKHGGDAERSLASIPAGRSTRDRLASIDDPDLNATIAHVASGSTEPDADATTTFSVGSSTADGLRFRVLRPHARGGLGAVFVAMDGELNREVALKQILDHHADDDASRHRFLLEAEITGGLEHPGIVPVYGLGAYSDGRPYYAMRFIRGDSLKQAIDRFHADASPKADPARRSLELRRLLRRFTDVCNAIEYAHSRGVLHRDIKPGNVIVGKHGETLVVDWGLAKATGRSEPGAEERTLQPSSSSGSSETLPGTAIGTPSYMSPEQARGDLDALGPRSDVYSLGATLFSLLTGRPPFQGDDVGAVLRAVREGTFPTPRQLDPSISRSLEAICLKAMATDPSGRYASARELSDDVDRWLADEPVAARREPWPERAWRSIRTHPIPSAAAAAALVVGLAASLFGLQRERAFATELAEANAALDRQRQRAEDREKMAIDAVRRFRDAVAENPELKYNRSLDELRETLLEEPLAFFRSLRERLQADPDASTTALARLATASHELGKLADEVGDQDDALRAFREARALRQQLVASEPESQRHWSDLASTQRALGDLLHKNGEWEKARAAMESSISISQNLLEQDPGVRGHSAELARTQTQFGTILEDMGEHARARATLKAASVTWQSIAQEESTSSLPRFELARCSRMLGGVLLHMGKPNEARDSLENAMAILDVLVEGQPATQYFVELIECHNVYGVCVYYLGEKQVAIDFWNSAIQSGREFVQRQPSVAEYRRLVAGSHVNLGRLLVEVGRSEEGASEFKKGLSMLRELTDAHPTVTRYHRYLAICYGLIGDLHRRNGHLADARAAYENALRIVGRGKGTSNRSHSRLSRIGAVLNDLAMIDYLEGDRRAAHARYREAIQRQKQAVDANPTNYEYRSFLANHLLGFVETSPSSELDHEVVEAYRQLEAVLEQLIDEQDLDRDYRIKLASAHQVFGQLASRVGLRQEALEVYRKERSTLSRLSSANPSDNSLEPKLRDVAQRIRLTEIAIMLDVRLAAALEGETLDNNTQRLELALHAYRTRRFAPAARLWGEALDDDPTLAESRETQHAYNASCSAALAADDQGVDAPDDDASRSDLRDRALTWLRGELDAWTALLASADDARRAAIAGTLRHWQSDPDLASIRDPDALSRLPEPERSAFEAFWRDVAGLLAEAEVLPLPEDVFAR